MLCINSRNLTLRKLISRSCPSPAEFLEKNYIIRLGVIVLRLQFYKKKNRTFRLTDRETVNKIYK